MFHRCDNRNVSRLASSGGSALAIAVLLLCTACSSSPAKNEPEPIVRAPTTQAVVEQGEPATAKTSSKATDKKADSKKSEPKKAEAKNVAAVVETPTGPPPPPPIPAEATQRFEKALTLLGGGDYGPAATEFQALSAAYPDYAGPLTNLGIVYLKTGKLADAEKALKAATQRGEPSAAALNQLGIVYRKLGKFKDADDAYSQALRIDPRYALAHLNLGVLCDMYLQQPQRALAEMEAYLQLVPNPDARVATWIKELQGRVGGSKPAAAAPAATGATPDATNKDSVGT